MAEKVQYKLNLPPDLYASLQEAAEEDGITVAEKLRRAIKLELLYGTVTKKGGRMLVEKEQEGQQIEILA